MDVVYTDATVEVHRVVVGPIANNVFAIRCTQSGEAVLVDAANEHGRLLELCRATGVRTIVETHGHWDHVGAVTSLRDAGYEVGVSEGDASMLPSYDYLIDDNATIECGALRIRAIATPGHTPGSICYHVEGTPLLFTGDTLFPGGPGATHFAGGDFPTIIESLRQLFAEFDDETIVLPGHGQFTTIGTERPNLDTWAERGW